ncbi:Palmitoyltransferase [Tilletia horrida]|nr:Palmitoyltransferase [Tilletia horrida]
MSTFKDAAAVPRQQARHIRSRRDEQQRHGKGGRPPLSPAELMWVTCTSALILFLSLTPQLFIILPYFYKTPTFTFTQLLRALMPFDAGIVAIFYNYHLCISVSPGRVPHGWEPDWDALFVPDSEQGASSKHAVEDDEQHSSKRRKREPVHPLAIPRFCRTCQAYKPPRSHHCKHCKTCTLKMDHHCPWVANCIGHANAPHFLRFLYAVEYSIIYHFALISARIGDWWSPPGAYWVAPGNAEMVLILLNYLGGIIVMLLVGVFCVYHTWLLCNGTTTIESSERDRVKTMVRRGRIREVKYPFDLGTYANVCAVLGSSPLYWIMPGLRTQQGNGLTYPCRPGTPAWLPLAWPPKDPTHPSNNFVGSGQDGRNWDERKTSHRRALRRRTELEQGWEWERSRHLHEDATDVQQTEGAEVPAESAYASGNAFTYGSESLNPALRSSNAEKRRRDFRVRRGSEGLEVKPRRFDLALAHEELLQLQHQQQGGPRPEWGHTLPSDGAEYDEDGTPAPSRSLPPAFGEEDDEEDDEGEGEDDDDEEEYDADHSYAATRMQQSRGGNAWTHSESETESESESEGVRDEQDSEGRYGSEDDYPLSRLRRGAGSAPQPAFPQVDLSKVTPLEGNDAVEHSATID